MAVSCIYRSSTETDHRRRDALRKLPLSGSAHIRLEYRSLEVTDEYPPGYTQ